MPWTLRHPNAALALLLVALVVGFTALWSALIQKRLRRRAHATLRFLDEPFPEAKQPNDGQLVVMRGRLCGLRQDKQSPLGTPLLDARGDKAVHLEFGLTLERGKDRIALVGPYQVLLGAREGSPAGAGRRLLRVGDEVLVAGRWSVQKVETTTYRDVVVKGAVVPSVDALEIAFVGTPLALGLAEGALAKGLAWGAFFWAALMSFGAYAALEIGYALNTDAHVIPVAQFVYMSPFLRSNAARFVREHAPLLHPRDFASATQWAAIEAFLDPDHECLKTLDNLRQTGRIETEAKLGHLCGGTQSKRRAADAWVHLGEFEKAAEILQTCPPPANPPPDNPDVALDILVAVVSKDWSKAAKLLRTHGHPAMAPAEEDCLALSLEARSGSFLSRDKLKSKAKTNLNCAVLEADLLEGKERLAFIAQIPSEMLEDNHYYLGEKYLIDSLHVEIDPSHPSHAHISQNPRFLMALSNNSKQWVSSSAIGLATLAKLDAMNDLQASTTAKRAQIEGSLGQFFAMTGEDAEAKRFSELAITHMTPEHPGYIDAMISRTSLAIRREDPKAFEYFAQTEKTLDPRFDDVISYLRGIQDVRKGTASSTSYYFAENEAPGVLVDAILKGAGNEILAHAAPQELVRHIIVAGRRIETGRDVLIDKIRYYDSGCLVKRCPVEYLAHQAGMRAVALEKLRPADVGREEDLRALQERARKLRAPLLQRDIAVILSLIERY